MDTEGEIVFVDRWTPRRYGIQGGSTGKDQRQYNKRRQRKHCNPDEWNEAFVPINDLPKEGRWKRFFHNLQTGISRGDVVVAFHPEKEGTVCKRVIGLPGDEIIPKQSQYTITHFVGKKRKDASGQRKWLHKVPDGHVWLEGDNSRNSRDSREYGPVPAALIVGRASFRVWRGWPFQGDNILERGMSPKSKKGQPRYDAQASKVLPAGYEGERIVREYKQTV